MLPLVLLRRLGLGVLLTEVLGSVDHVGEGALDLIPLAGLQTAIRVDPELLRADCLPLVRIHVWLSDGGFNLRNSSISWMRCLNSASGGTRGLWMS